MLLHLRGTSVQTVCCSLRQPGFEADWDCSVRLCANCCACLELVHSRLQRCPGLDRWVGGPQGCQAKPSVRDHDQEGACLEHGAEVLLERGCADQGVRLAVLASGQRFEGRVLLQH